MAAVRAPVRRRRTEHSGAHFSSGAALALGGEAAAHATGIRSAWSGRSAKAAQNASAHTAWPRSLGWNQSGAKSVTMLAHPPPAHRPVKVPDGGASPTSYAIERSGRLAPPLAVRLQRQREGHTLSGRARRS